MADADELTGVSSANVEPIAPVLFKSRGRRAANSTMRKRSPLRSKSRSEPSDSDSDSSSSEGDHESGVRSVKRRRKHGTFVTVTPGAKSGSVSNEKDQSLHTADRGALLADSEVATKLSHFFDDNEAKNGRNSVAAPGSANDRTPAPPSRSVGPVKAPANIRTITITDFSPDVCKDYKLTGFCGFGESCKFLHAREDYKQGWQLDNEWEAVTKSKKNIGGTIVASASRNKNNGQDLDDDAEDNEEAMLRDIPFACIICQQAYKQPVVTRCGHYFCERCALGRYRRDPTCAACGSATTGVFNNAKRLTRLLERKRQREAKQRQAAIEAGEEYSGEEEEGDSA